MSEYFIIKKELLPTYMENVVKAKKLIEQDNKSITQACNICDISRSTYYKYKDGLYEMSDFRQGRKAQLNLLIANTPGSLNKVVDIFNSQMANIITINQSIPLNETASISITIDTSDMKLSISELVSMLENLTIVTNVKLISLE